jgi:hypothetical protein
MLLVWHHACNVTLVFILIPQILLHVPHVLQVHIPLKLVQAVFQRVNHVHLDFIALYLVLLALLFANHVHQVLLVMYQELVHSKLVHLVVVDSIQALQDRPHVLRVLLVVFLHNQVLLLVSYVHPERLQLQMHL